MGKRVNVTSHVSHYLLKIVIIPFIQIILLGNVLLSLKSILLGERTLTWASFAFIASITIFFILIIRIFLYLKLVTITDDYLLIGKEKVSYESIESFRFQTLFTPPYATIKYITKNGIKKKRFFVLPLFSDKKKVELIKNTLSKNGCCQ